MIRSTKAVVHVFCLMLILLGLICQIDVFLKEKKIKSAVYILNSGSSNNNGGGSICTAFHGQPETQIVNPGKYLLTIKNYYDTVAQCEEQSEIPLLLEIEVAGAEGERINYGLGGLGGLTTGVAYYKNFITQLGLQSRSDIKLIIVVGGKGAGGIGGFGGGGGGKGAGGGGGSAVWIDLNENNQESLDELLLVAGGGGGGGCGVMKISGTPIMTPCGQGGYGGGGNSQGGNGVGFQMQHASYTCSLVICPGGLGGGNGRGGNGGYWPSGSSSSSWCYERHDGGGGGGTGSGGGIDLSYSGGGLWMYYSNVGGGYGGKGGYTGKSAGYCHCGNGGYNCGSYVGGSSGNTGTGMCGGGGSGMTSYSDSDGYCAYNCDGGGGGSGYGGGGGGAGGSGGGGGGYCNTALFYSCDGQNGVKAGNGYFKIKIKPKVDLIM